MMWSHKCPHMNRWKFNGNILKGGVLIILDYSEVLNLKFHKINTYYKFAFFKRRNLKMISWQPFFLIPTCTGGINRNCAAIGFSARLSFGPAKLKLPMIIYFVVPTMKLKTVLKNGENYQHPWIATFG